MDRILRSRGTGPSPSRITTSSMVTVSRMFRIRSGLILTSSPVDIEGEPVAAVAGVEEGQAVPVGVPARAGQGHGGVVLGVAVEGTVQAGSEPGEPDEGGAAPGAPPPPSDRHVLHAHGSLPSNRIPRMRPLRGSQSCWTPIGWMPPSVRVVRNWSRTSRSRLFRSYSGISGSRPGRYMPTM